MSYFHPINRIEDRQRMLEKILSLQTQVRAKREKDRLVSSSRNEKYTKIFEPITQTLKHIADIPSVPSKNNNNNNNLTATGSTTTTDDLKPFTVKKEDDDDDEEEEHEQEEPRPGELYREALKIVPPDDRDDGTFGLDTVTEKIGDYTFTIDGDRLKLINDEDEEDKREYVIDDNDLWTILLARAPGSYMVLTRPSNTPTKGKSSSYVPAVKDYIEIANELNLLETAEEHGGNYKRLSKYKILNKARSGKGFLFSIKPPPFLHKKLNKKNFKPSTVVIPSDKKGLMRALLQALAELRAGNTSMRNLVVPLAQEAKRKRILPVNLLSPDEETWVFA